MTLLLIVINVAACLVTFYVCATFLVVRDKPGRAMQAMAQFGLLLAMMGHFVAGIAPIASVEAAAPEWWVVVMRCGISFIALHQYDKAFGIARQWRCFVTNIQTSPARLRAWWDDRLHIARKHNQQRNS